VLLYLRENHLTDFFCDTLSSNFIVNSFAFGSLLLLSTVLNCIPYSFGSFFLSNCYVYVDTWTRTWFSNKDILNEMR
jgi:hypothetical protein